MNKQTKIKIKKQKKRIPVPQKPPKVEEDKRRYKRAKVKKEIDELLKNKDSEGE